MDVVSKKWKTEYTLTPVRQGLIGGECDWVTGDVLKIVFGELYPQGFRVSTW
jgi:hypothetical protein